MACPNVLMICVDHWPGGLLGAEGHCAVMTPTLDQLCSTGVRFTHAYSAAPTCIPARRTLMTGTCARTHGDRAFNERLEMPDVPTLAQAFRDAGYQAYAVGKLHVYPQRDRIGFDDVILNEEGRHHLGLSADDYELFLADQGCTGQELTHAMCTNDYMTRPWHLGEDLHPTNWTAREMCRTIRRRDPRKPAFWCMSFNFPHPPLVPLRDYVDMYRAVEIDEPFVGRWALDPSGLPYALRALQHQWSRFTRKEVGMARRAFYALCTHIDHQMRLVIGILREEGLLENTIILFTCDHGDMLGNHGLCRKGTFYEWSARVPLILVPHASCEKVRCPAVDDRVAELRDVMPTLLDLAGIPVPESVEGISLAGDARREFLYGEHYEDERATRMIFDGRYKLIYYPVGNVTQLFDLAEDPDELRDVSEEPQSVDVRQRLTALLIENLHGGDCDWLEGGNLVGLPDRDYDPTRDATLRKFYGQRGWRFM